MKQLFVALFVLAIGVNSVFAQSKNAPAFKFEKGTSHDFGTIAEGPEVTYYFEFTNTGKEPLIIQNVSASCGCDRRGRYGLVHIQILLTALQHPVIVILFSFFERFYW